MTERWQKELRKLRSVDAPVELRARVDCGPTGDGLPPTRQRVLAGVVAFAVFAGAGAFAWRVLTPAPSAEIASPTPSSNPSSPVAASEVLRVRCEGGEAQVMTPLVTAQPDGLHILPIGVPDTFEIVVWSSAQPNATFLSGSSGVANEFVRPAAPGALSVGCSPSGVHSESELESLRQRGTPAELSDPGGYFTPSLPECAHTEPVMSLAMRGLEDPGQPQDMTPTFASVEDGIRALLEGIQEHDSIEPAGYRAWDIHRRYRIVRDGSVIAELLPAPATSSREDGAKVFSVFLVDGEVCVGSGITAKFPYRE